MKRLFIILTLLTLTSACKFRKPLLAIRTATNQHDTTYHNAPNGVDTSDHYILTKGKFYKYLSFRNGVSIGRISIIRQYNKGGQIDHKWIFKSTGFKTKNKSYQKEIHYLNGRANYFRWTIWETETKKLLYDRECLHGKTIVHKP